MPGPSQRMLRPPIAGFRARSSMPGSERVGLGVTEWQKLARGHVIGSMGASGLARTAITVANRYDIGPRERSMGAGWYKANRVAPPEASTPGPQYQCKALAWLVQGLPG